MASWEELGITQAEDTRDMETMESDELSITPVHTHHGTLEWLVEALDEDQMPAPYRLCTTYARAREIAKTLL